MIKIKKLLKIKSPQIISELGINHEGNLNLAKRMVNLIHKNGGLIVKNQSHDLKGEMSNHAKKIKPSNANKSIYSVIKQNYMKFDDEIKLKEYVEKKKMLYISTPFSIDSAIKLNELNVKIFKIGSGEFNNIPLIEKIAKFKKPMILSTGMNDLKSIKETVLVLKKNKVHFSLLHCVSEYPAQYRNLKLDFINTLKKNFDKITIGYSDHSNSIFPCIIAMAKGAEIIEKHFTDTKKRKGPDIICSMDPEELKSLILASKINFEAKGFNKKITKKELITAKFAFSSVVAVKKIKKGEKLNNENIWVKRPGNGDFLAKNYKKLLNKKVKTNIKLGSQISKKHI